MITNGTVTGELSNGSAGFSVSASMYYHKTINKYFTLTSQAFSVNGTFNNGSPSVYATIYADIEYALV